MADLLLHIVAVALACFGIALCFDALKAWLTAKRESDWKHHDGQGD